MEIHSLSFKKNEIFPNKSLTSSNPFQSNDNSKNDFNLVKFNLDKYFPLSKDKPKYKEYKNNNKKIDKKENVENEQIGEIVPQKILKFNKKSLSLKKKNLNEKTIRIYQNALMDKLQLIVANSNHKNKNTQNLNNLGEQTDLKQEEKNHSFFNNYRDYQKEFLSSAYNLKYNNNYSKINFNKIKNTSITPINNKSKNKLLKKNNSFIQRSISNILQRRNHGELPIFLNSPVTFMKNFQSYSEKERDDKNSHALLRLRDFLDIYWDKRIELVSEFFSTYQINKKEYYTLKNLENFAHYIYDNISDDTNVTKGIIETRIPMKEIIEKGIQYNNYSSKKLKHSKSIPKINNNNSLNTKIIQKNLTSNNWNNSNKAKDKNKLNKNINLNFRKSRSFKNNNIININNCFYNDNYINNDYEISDREVNQKILLDERIEKYRKYLNRNYGAKVNNIFMRKYNQVEKNNYFSKRKVGKIDILDKDNLVNNINKQSNFYKLKSTSFSIRKNQPIQTFSEKDFKELLDELREAKESYLFENKNNINNEKGNIWIKMYEDVKKHNFEKNPELILKKKKKLDLIWEKF